MLIHSHVWLISGYIHLHALSNKGQGYTIGRIINRTLNDQLILCDVRLISQIIVESSSQNADFVCIHLPIKDYYINVIVINVYAVKQRKSSRHGQKVSGGAVLCHAGCQRTLGLLFHHLPNVAACPDLPADFPQVRRSALLLLGDVSGGQYILENSKLHVKSNFTVVNCVMLWSIA